MALIMLNIQKYPKTVKIKNFLKPTILEAEP
jgi:hypothetical protein